MNESIPRLPAHEWAAVAVFISILLFIGITNLWVNQRDSQLTVPLAPNDEVFVTLQGAVSKPGSYKVKKGEKLGSVIGLSEPHESADLSKIELNKSLRYDRIIEIPNKKMITLYLEGYVKPRGAIQMEAGATLHQLYEKIEILKNESDYLKHNNRPLHHEEVIKFNR